MNSKELLIISVIIFLSVVAWMGFDVYYRTTTSTITPIQQQQINPLTPKFDNDIIQSLKKREK